MTVGKWGVIWWYESINFDWVIKCKIIRNNSFLIDDIHKDKKIRHYFQLFIRIFMINIIPIIIKELKQWSKKLEKNSTSRKWVDSGWKRCELLYRWIKRIKCLLDWFFIKIFLRRSWLLGVLCIWLICSVCIGWVINLLSVIGRVLLWISIVYCRGLSIRFIDSSIGKRRNSIIIGIVNSCVCRILISYVSRIGGLIYYWWLCWYCLVLWCVIGRIRLCRICSISLWRSCSINLCHICTIWLVRNCLIDLWNALITCWI